MCILKTIFILLFAAHNMEAAFLRCYNGSLYDSMELPLENSQDFINGTVPYIRSDCDLLIVSHGYLSEISEYTNNITASYMQRYDNKMCYCALNWKEEASTYIGDANPIEVLFNHKLLGDDLPLVKKLAEKVATQLGEALVKMHRLGLRLAGITLIGHGEGAHLCGNAARFVKRKTKTMIGNVIGLDPAKQALQPALNKDCAKFVYSLHTDSSRLGTDKSVGHIDFWLNCDCQVQPGCKSNYKSFSNDSLCSHQRAMVIMAYATWYPRGFSGLQYCTAVHCNGCKQYFNIFDLENSREDATFNNIGPNIDPSETGSFYVCTRAERPFGYYNVEDPHYIECCSSSE